MSFLEFTFQSIYHFIGVFILLEIVISGLVEMVKDIFNSKNKDKE